MSRRPPLSGWSRWGWPAGAVLLVASSIVLTALAVSAADAGQSAAAGGAGTAQTGAAATARLGPTQGDFTAVPPPPFAGGAADPVALTIAAAGVASTLDPIGLGRGGEIEPPPRWQVPGWYSGGPAPGEQGPAVVLGHVDSPDGPAVFARLDELRPGDRVEVARADGSTAVFTVDRSVTVSQEGFPTAEVYGPTPDAQLRLITCDGDYDRAAGRYLHNLVVFATLARD